MVCLSDPDVFWVVCVIWSGLSIEIDGFCCWWCFLGFWKWIRKGRYLWWSSMKNGCLTLMLSLGFLKKNFLNHLSPLLLNSPLCMILHVICDIFVIVFRTKIGFSFSLKFSYFMWEFQLWILPFVCVFVGCNFNYIKSVYCLHEKWILQTSWHFLYINFCTLM